MSTRAQTLPTAATLPSPAAAKAAEVNGDGPGRAAAAAVRMLAALAGVAGTLLLASCGPVGRGFDAGWTERAAQDRIMLVRAQPETLGHRRLAHQSVDHPDLGRFLQMKGQPDFIAETSSDERQYLILYYLKGNHAFAGRSKRVHGADMDFAGPYSMTQREAKLLGQFKRQATVGPEA